MLRSARKPAAKKAKDDTPKERRHRWDKVADHFYRCRQCDIVKVNHERGPNDWAQIFQWPDGREAELRHVPPCEDVPALDDIPPRKA